MSMQDPRTIAAGHIGELDYEDLILNPVYCASASKVNTDPIPLRIGRRSKSNGSFTADFSFNDLY